MPTAAPPDYYSLLCNTIGKKITPESRLNAVATLDAANPVNKLALEAFIALLELIVTSYAVVHGRANTKTHIQFRQGLEVLQGRAPTTHLNVGPASVWRWEGLAELNMEPAIAFVYQRMVNEVRARAALETKE